MRDGSVEYFDFAPDRLGRWQDAAAWTLAAARVRASGEARSVTVLICGYPEQWTASEDRRAAQEDLIARARQTLADILARGRYQVDEAGDVTIAFLVYGFRVAPPRGRWGENTATHRRGAFPAPVSS